MVAKKIVWLLEAVHDLEEIVRYIERRSPSYASVVAARILETVERLSDFPGIGGIIAEDDSGRHRHLVCYHYRIIYRVEGSYVCIIAVVHGARELPGEILLRRRPARKRNNGA